MSSRPSDRRRLEPFRRPLFFYLEFRAAEEEAKEEEDQAGAAEEDAKEEEERAGAAEEEVVHEVEVGGRGGL